MGRETPAEEEEEEEEEEVEEEEEEEVVEEEEEEAVRVRSMTATAQPVWSLSGQARWGRP